VLHLALLRLGLDGVYWAEVPALGVATWALTQTAVRGLRRLRPPALRLAFLGE
jgi:hypothetical protein